MNVFKFVDSQRCCCCFLVSGLPRVTLQQRVVGLGAGTDGAPEGEIQKLTSSFLLGRRVHMSPIEDESLLISLEHSEAAGMK